MLKALQDKKGLKKLNNLQSLYLTDLLGLENGRKKTMGMNKNQVVSGDQKDDQRMEIESQKEEYWHKRCLNAYKWCCALTLTNVVFQILYLAYPRTGTQYAISLIFLTATFISIALLIYGFKKQRFLQNITYGVLSYLIVRNSCRIIDFEKSLEDEALSQEDKVFLTIGGVIW